MVHSAACSVNWFSNAIEKRVPRIRVWLLILTVLLLAITGCARHRDHIQHPGISGAMDSPPSIWPVDYPGKRITSVFGEPRSGHRHRGIDIAVPEGTPVMAAASGMAVFSGWQRGYGNIIILCHGHEYETVYAHLRKRLVDCGNQVRCGQKIGLVGRTGNATGSHLHYEIRKKGVAIDPKPWLP